jgi:hypothetical protein
VRIGMKISGDVVDMAWLFLAFMFLLGLLLSLRDDLAMLGSVKRR